MVFREDVVTANQHGWVNVVVTLLPESGEVEILVEWQEEFGATPIVQHRWIVEPSMSDLKSRHVHFSLWGNDVQRSLVFAAIIRCTQKALVHLK